MDFKVIEIKIDIYLGIYSILIEENRDFKK